MVLLNFGDWWEGLAAFTKIYWMIAIPATFIFLIQLALSFLEKKNEEVPIITTKNIGIDGAAAITFQVITFRNFIGFFTSLGWSGLACIDSGLTTPIIIATSFFCGSIVMITMAIVFYFMNKLMKTVEDSL